MSDRKSSIVKLVSIVMILAVVVLIFLNRTHKIEYEEDILQYLNNKYSTEFSVLRVSNNKNKETNKEKRAEVSCAAIEDMKGIVFNVYFDTEDLSNMEDDLSNLLTMSYIDRDIEKNVSDVAMSYSVIKTSNLAHNKIIDIDTAKLYINNFKDNHKVTTIVYLNKQPKTADEFAEISLNVLNQIKQYNFKEVECVICILTEASFNDWEREKEVIKLNLSFTDKYIETASKFSYKYAIFSLKQNETVLTKEKILDEINKSWNL